MAHDLVMVTSNSDLWLIVLTSLKEFQEISSSGDKLRTWGNLTFPCCHFILSDFEDGKTKTVMNF